MSTDFLEPAPPPPDMGGPLRRYLPAFAIVAVLVLVGGIGTTIHHSPAASTNGAGTVTPLPLTAATASAQHRHVDFGPSCDPATGRVKIPSVYAAPCVVGGATGGATWQGVTKDTITIAVYHAAPDLLQQATLAGGGAADTVQQTDDTLAHYVAFFEAHYQTWGRKVVLKPVEASGGAADDAAAKADAIRVATEIKAFASFDGPTQTDAYTKELAARHVLCIGCDTGTTDATIRANAPYVWGVQPSPEQQNVLTAEYVGKRLKDAPASYAGDPAMQHKPRVFGLLAYDTPTGTFGPVHDDLVRQLRSYGVTVSTIGTYTLDVTRAQELARTLITKMKSAGVTSIIFDGDPLAPVFLTPAATNQHYFPEWIITGSLLTDTSVFGRLYDQAQWKHAFGLSELPGRVNEVNSLPYLVYEWQFGQKPPAGATYPLIFMDPFMLMTGIHLAGPHLTPAQFEAVMFSYPPSGGSPTNAHFSYGHHPYWPQADYLGFDDATQIWWDPLAAGQDEIGRTGGVGLYHYEENARRYLHGQFPTTPDHPFDPAGTVTIFTKPPDPPPCYPSPGAFPTPPDAVCR